MADKKISALTASSTPLAGTEVLPIVQGGSTVKVSVANLTAGRDTSVKDLNASGNVVSKGTAIFFGDGLDNSAYVYATGGPVHIFANAAATFDFTTDGNLKPLTAGKGIDFSVNSNAPGMTSEVLSDYEEGTFTPTISSTSGAITTYTINSARYTKIGRVVHIVIQFGVSNNGTGAGQIFIQGFPFANVAATCGMTYNQSTGAVGAISINTSATDGYINQYDGTYPIASGQTLQLNLTYIV